MTVIYGPTRVRHIPALAFTARGKERAFLTPRPGASRGPWRRPDSAAPQPYAPPEAPDGTAPDRWDVTPWLSVAIIVALIVGAWAVR